MNQNNPQINKLKKLYEEKGIDVTDLIIAKEDKQIKQLKVMNKKQNTPCYHSIIKRFIKSSNQVVNRCSNNKDGSKRKCSYIRQCGVTAYYCKH